eukprot:EG_transcript_20382
MRAAFGQQLGLADPSAFMGDAALVRCRFPNDTLLAAEVEGRLAGFIAIAVWGSFAFFGPLAVDPQHQGHGVAQALLQATMAHLRAIDAVKHVGLFTFPSSTKHLHLYEKYGFRPRYLTYVLQKNLPEAVNHSDALRSHTLFSAAAAQGSATADAALAAALRLTSGVVYPGLDLRREIRAVQRQELGDTVFAADGTAFAICHVGPGTEAETGMCFVKFAAAQDADAMDALLSAVEQFASQRRATRLTLGVNTARTLCYDAIRRRGGYRTIISGIAMQLDVTPPPALDAPGYNRPDAFVLDDWR